MSKQKPVPHGFTLCLAPPEGVIAAWSGTFVCGWERGGTHTLQLIKSDRPHRPYFSHDIFFFWRDREGNLYQLLHGQYDLSLIPGQPPNALALAVCKGVVKYLQETTQRDRPEVLLAHEPQPYLIALVDAVLKKAIGMYLHMTSTFLQMAQQELDDRELKIAQFWGKKTKTRWYDLEVESNLAILRRRIGKEDDPWRWMAELRDRPNHFIFVECDRTPVSEEALKEWKSHTFVVDLKYRVWRGKNKKVPAYVTKERLAHFQVDLASCDKERDRMAAIALHFLARLLTVEPYPQIDWENRAIAFVKEICEY